MILPMIKSLGERIRKLRKTKGITLVELSKKTGVAQATLSRIETGTMTGTVESHERIAEAIGIGLAELYTGIDSRYEEISHLPKEAERKVTQQSKDVRLELLTAESSRKKITPLQISLQPNAKSESESNERGVEKFVYVLEGDVVVHVDNSTYELKTEETLYFDASLVHFYHNASEANARLLVAVSPSKI